MSITVKTVSAALVSSATLVLLTGARGAPNFQGQFPFCNQYAFTAVDQVKRAFLGNCNFSGGRWDERRRHHYDWCVQQTSKAFPNSEQGGREDQLRKCKAPAVGTPIFRP